MLFSDHLHVCESSEHIQEMDKTDFWQRQQQIMGVVENVT